MFIKLQFSYELDMRRTVFHIPKELLNDLSCQSNHLFPFLESQNIQNYAKSIIKFKKIHAVCNYNNVNTVVPLPSPSKQFIFFGKSNVGKSTLLNKLMQQSVAAVSKRPGKTKQLLFCQIGSKSLAQRRLVQSGLYFVDAPGYGYATGVSKTEINQWGKLITTYLKRTKQNSINQQFFCLLDVNQELKQTDALVFQLLKEQGKRFMLIFTKCDKFQLSTENADLKRGLQTATMIQSKYSAMNYYVHFTSSRTFLGIDNLRNHIMFQIVSEKL